MKATWITCYTQKTETHQKVKHQTQNTHFCADLYLNLVINQQLENK